MASAIYYFVFRLFDIAIVDNFLLQFFEKTLIGKRIEILQTMLI